MMNKQWTYLGSFKETRICNESILEYCALISNDNSYSMGLFGLCLPDCQIKLDVFCEKLSICFAI